MFYDFQEIQLFDQLIKLHGQLNNRFGNDYTLCARFFLEKYGSTEIFL